MTRLLKVVIFLIQIPIAIFAVDGQGYVNKIYPTNYNRVYFNLKNDACKDSDKYYYFDGDTEKGKKFFSLLLTAANKGAYVYVELPGSCSVSQSQEISYIFVAF